MTLTQYISGILSEEPLYGDNLVLNDMFDLLNEVANGSTQRYGLDKTGLNRQLPSNWLNSLAKRYARLVKDNV